MITAFAKDFIRYVPSRIIPGVFAILIIPLITRLMAPEDYGQYVIVISTVSFFGIIATEWIAMSITRFYPVYEKESQLHIFYGTILKMTVISTLLISSFTFLLIFFSKGLFSTDLHYYLKIGLILLAISVFYTITSHILVVQRKPNYYSLFIIWRQCICSLLGLSLIWMFGFGADGLLWGHAIGMIIMFPSLFHVVFKNQSIKGYSKTLCIENIQYGFPLVATNLAGWVLTLSDRYIIEYFRGSYEVGLYSISYQMANNTIQAIVLLTGLASAPIVMEIWEKKGAEETRKFVNNLTKVFLIIAVPATVGVSILAKSILQLLTTENFYDGYRIMPLVAWSILIFGLQRNFQIGLLIHNKTKYIMYAMFFAGLTNIILNFIFIPLYGFLAAGYTTLISYIIFTILIILISRKYFTWAFPYITLIKTLFASLLMATSILLIIHLNFKSLLVTISLSIITGIVIYFSLLLLFKEFDKNTLKIIFSKSKATI
jgi:O-antigen/teichoic acid export membrane protein